MIPASPGYDWKRATNGWVHQVLIEAVPDSEGVISTKCEKLAVLDRNPDDLGAICVLCLTGSPSDQLADRMESHYLALPAAAHSATDAELGLS